MPPKSEVVTSLQSSDAVSVPLDLRFCTMASTTPCVRPCNGLPVPQLAAASTPDDWATVGARPESLAVAIAIAMAATTAAAAATLDSFAMAAPHDFRTLVPPPV